MSDELRVQQLLDELRLEFCGVVSLLAHGPILP